MHVGSHSNASHAALASKDKGKAPCISEVQDVGAKLVRPTFRGKITDACRVASKHQPRRPGKEKHIFKSALHFTRQNVPRAKLVHERILVG
jgi:hypothetical protein